MKARLITVNDRVHLATSSHNPVCGKIILPWAKTKLEVAKVTRQFAQEHLCKRCIARSGLTFDNGGIPLTKDEQGLLIALSANESEPRISGFHFSKHDLAVLRRILDKAL